MTRRRFIPLMQFIPRLSPKWTEPRHLSPVVAMFERIACGEAVRAVANTPPRHGKTELELHAVPWLLLQRPALRIAFVSYAQTFAEKKSRRARELAIKAGVPIADDARSRRDWRTGVEDGGVWASSIGGPLTGEGFDVLLIDDPVKDRATAESAASRAATYEWFNDVAFTRLEPNGSCLVVQTRWHVEDLAGHLLRDGWESVNLPALDATGRALWPERWPASKLHQVREQLGDYGWSSLYQGEPRPRGGALFGDFGFYDELPATLEKSIGVDFAYSTRTHADYSVAVVLGRDGDRFFVVDVVRLQVKAPEFKSTIERLLADHHVATATSFIGGTERGVVDMMAAQGLAIDAKPATADKFTRAQPVAAAWNAGKVLLPREARWLDAFANELASFTGVGDRHDDQVDALAAAHHALGVTGAYDGMYIAYSLRDSASPGPGVWRMHGGRYVEGGSR